MKDKKLQKSIIALIFAIALPIILFFIEGSSIGLTCMIYMYALFIFISSLIYQSSKFLQDNKLLSSIMYLILLAFFILLSPGNWLLNKTLSIRKSLFISGNSSISLSAENFRHTFKAIGFKVDNNKKAILNSPAAHALHQGAYNKEEVTHHVHSPDNQVFLYYYCADVNPNRAYTYNTVLAKTNNKGQLIVFCGLYGNLVIPAKYNLLTNKKTNS